MIRINRSTGSARSILSSMSGLGLALYILVGLVFSVGAQTVIINNPYKNVDWETHGQYKAALHVHSTNSDGSNTRTDMIERHYERGFDIVPFNDHNFVTTAWDEAGYGRGVGLSNPGIGALSSARRAEIESGVGRNGRGMIGLSYTNEQSVVDHINTYWASFNNTALGGLSRVQKMEEIFARTEELGGISVINHPGRETGGSAGGTSGENVSNNPATIGKYVDLFSKYPNSLVGMEIINRLDNESRSDRILWDNILQQTIPQGKYVWGFSNDDAHGVNEVGYSYNMMILPELSESATRTAMETGAFYAVSYAARREGVRPTAGASGSTSTVNWLSQNTPRITNIAVDEKTGTITIEGTDFDVIEWIADGVKIASGATIDINEYQDQINNYVRAQLIKNDVGIAFTQPFGVTVQTLSPVVITKNPYEGVNWGSINQYKAALHLHTTNSDGAQDRLTMVQRHYDRGYDIMGHFDHNFLTTTWDGTGKGALTAAQIADFNNGVGREGRGMIGLTNTNEQSVTDHINTLFAPFNNTSGQTMAQIIKTAHDLGGISFINHPGRETGGSAGGTSGANASNNPNTIKKYVDLFNAYPNSLVGMEIINRLDNESRSDRILWDNILQQTIPQGKYVWGFSNDDAHGVNEVGYSYNIMLMPELSESATRTAMETGAFYAVSHVARREGVRATAGSTGSTSTVSWFDQSLPRITNVSVDKNIGTISIDGTDYDRIEWIADGAVIYTGNTIDLGQHIDQITSYVRAQLIKNDVGIAFTQPFGVEGSGAVIVKIDQPTISIAAADGVISKTVGDAPFSLADMVTGGSGTGAWEYRSGNVGVATINNDGLVTIIDAGTTTLTASKLGDKEYNASNVAEVTLTVEPDGSIALAAVSNFGDNYWYYGRTNSVFFDDAFDMSKTTDWTNAKTAIGFGAPVSGTGLTLATTIPAGTGPSQRGANHTWYYFKKTFEVADDYDPANLIGAVGAHRLDDAVIVYINGIEVYRYNVGAVGNANNVTIDQPVNWGAYTGYNSDAAERTFAIKSDYSNRDTESRSTTSGNPNLRDAGSLTNLIAALKRGTNVITCAVGQNSSSSSDIWFDMKMSIEYTPVEPTEPTVPIVELRWTPDPNAYSNNMTVSSVVTLNGVMQNSAQIEIGAFDSTGAVRGSNTLKYVEGMGGYVGYLTVHGDSGEKITLKVYDHASGKEYDAENAPLVFADNARFGEYPDYYVIEAFDKYAISLPSGLVGCTVTAYGASASPVNHGGSYSFTVNLETGYTNSVPVVKANGVVLTADEDGVYTIGNITSEQVVTVDGVALNTYIVSVSANPAEGGTVTGGNTYNHGANVIVTAAAADGYEFVNWTEDGVEVSTANSYSFTAKTPRTLTANFDPIVTQTLSIGKGWNWISANVINDDPSILEQMKSGLGAVGIQIKGQTDYVDKYPFGWDGTLTDISATKMYKVNVSDDAQVSLTGRRAASSTAIDIDKGWNYIGYIPSSPLTVSAALAHADPQDGDQVKGQSGYAEYNSVIGWSGSLDYMRAGSGYMYYSSGTDKRQFVYPAQSGLSKAQSSHAAMSSPAIAQRYTVDARAYQNNMTVSAIVTLDGIELRSDEVEVAAVSGDDIRGSAVLRYVAGADKYVGYLMVYGTGGEAITLKVYDHASGKEYDAENAPLVFASDAMYGTPDYYPVAITNAYTSTMSDSRTIPVKSDENAAVVAPTSRVSAEVTAGPNPVAIQSGAVTFFLNGPKIANAQLTIYDASGNAVRKINVTDNKDGNDSRAIGTWDLRDAKGRAVSVGTYLVRGVIKTASGKREKVSVMIGVR